MDLEDNLQMVERQIAEIQSMADDLSEERAKLYNDFVKMVARQDYKCDYDLCG